MKCGGSSIRCCGNSPKIPGSSCRRSRETRSSVSWPIRSFARTLTVWCRPGGKRWKRRHGFSRIIHRSPDLRRLFQHGIHVERSAADLLGRTGQCGWRSAQSRQRSGRAGGRRGTALPARLFPPGHRQGRGATGSLSHTTILGSCRSRPLRQANGEWLRLEITLPGYSVWLRAWQVQVGRAKLYLLDSNDPANIRKPFIDGCSAFPRQRVLLDPGQSRPGEPESHPPIKPIQRSQQQTSRSARRRLLGIPPFAWGGPPDPVGAPAAVSRRLGRR